MLTDDEHVMGNRDHHAVDCDGPIACSDFSRVHRQYERLVYYYAYRRLGHREDAEDIKQETFLRAYRSLDAFRQTASLKTWLLSICNNLCIDHLRSRATDARLCEQLRQGYAHNAASMLDPAVVFSDRQRVETLHTALLHLSPDQRRLFLIHYWEGVGCTALGLRLGCSTSAVKVRLFRGRQRLKKVLETHRTEGRSMMQRFDWMP